MAGWLAEPAPVGALAFVSGDAALAGAFAARDGVTMFDDVLGILGIGEPDVDLVAEATAELGVNPRDDIAAAIGGEIAFALDGALLPDPAWKLVVEVNDPARLQAAIAAMVDRAAAEGQTIALQTDDSGGRVDYRVVVDGKDRAVYTYVDGYLLAAARRDLIDAALRYRADGFTLERSVAFRTLLPADAQPHYSAIWYQNLGPAIEPLTSAGELAGGEAALSLRMMAESLGPSLAVAYADDDTITVASRGGMGPFGLDPAGLMSSAQAAALAGP
jgi:hypothetical protein